MKTFKNAALVTALFVGMAAAAAAPSSFLGDTSKFKKSKNFPDTRSYRHPTKKAADYSQFLVEPVELLQSKNSEYEKFSADEKKRLSELFQSIVIDTLGKDYAVVDAPAPGVLKIRCAIQGLRRGYYYLDAAGPQTISPQSRLTAATFELETIDSASGERIGALIHEIKNVNQDKATRTEALVTAQELFTDWAQKLKSFLDKEKATK